MRVFLCSVLFFISGITVAQPACDSLPAKRIQEFDTYSSRKFNRIRKSKNTELQTLYEIATYYRLKSDTRYRSWYSRFLDRAKYDFSYRRYGDKSSNAKTVFIFATGKAYYYLDDLNQANAWFIKAYKANYQDLCLDTFYADTKKKLQNAEH